MPSRSYTGRPIGTTYTLAVFLAPGAGEVKVGTSCCWPHYLHPPGCQEPEDKRRMVQMVFWLREVFPPMETIRPVMAVSRDNLFKGGNSPEIHRVYPVSAST